MEQGQLLLEAVAAGIRGRQVNWDGRVNEVGWRELFELAHQHHVAPLVAEAVYRCPDYLSQPENWRGRIRREAVRLVMGQTMRSAALADLCRAMEAAGFHPAVMKGAACRSTYPMPDARPSSDEDLLVPEEEFVSCAAWLEGRGCIRKKANEAPEKAFELGYNTPEGLYLELHKTPFAPDSGAFGACNAFFAEACRKRAFLEGDNLPVMSPHDHMLYLILHAFKHLIHSGFGIRQVSDILLWGAAYREEIDWTALRQQCESMRAWGFVQAVFQIGHEGLGLPLPVETGGKPGLGRALLEDMLAGGVFGGTDLSRKHSSTITLHAVEAQHTGKKSGLLSTLFPPKTAMEKKYPYVEKAAILLPVAWLHRIVRYGAEKKDESNRPSDSLRIGKERMTLLKELGILE